MKIIYKVLNNPNFILLHKSNKLFQEIMKYTKKYNSIGLIMKSIKYK